MLFKEKVYISVKLRIAMKNTKNLCKRRGKQIKRMSAKSFLGFNIILIFNIISVDIQL
jgi:hypothetical protein